jgi:hypothetical protein
MKLAALLPFLPFALGSPALSKRQGGPAPILRSRDARLLPNKYIVKLKPGSSTEALSKALDLFPGDAERVYTSDAFKGFATSLDSKSLTAIQNSNDVS